jgi:hypothetical protein
LRPSGRDAFGDAETMTGYRGHKVEAIDHDRLIALLRIHKMLIEPGTIIPSPNLDE